MPIVILIYVTFMDMNAVACYRRQTLCEVRGGIAVGRYKQTCLEADKKAEAVR